MKLLLVLSLPLILLTGCNYKSEWEKEYERTQNNINTLRDAITAEYGAAVVAKQSSAGGETYVVYQISATGEYLAFNLTKWNGATMTTLAQFVDDGNDIVRGLEKKSEWVTSGHYEDITEMQWVTKSEYVTEYRDYTSTRYDGSCSCYVTETFSEPYSYYKDVSGYENVKIGERYVDTSGYKNFYYGGNFRFSNSAGATHDLDTMAAVRESMTVKGYAQRLKSEYALSNDRAKELAELAVKQMRIESQRELTESEKNSFAMKGLGVSMAQVEKSLKARARGDERSYEQLLKDAAKLNRTTPEMIGRFFDDMIQ